MRYLCALATALSLAGCSGAGGKPTPTQPVSQCDPFGQGSIDEACCGIEPTLSISTGGLEYEPMPQGYEATMVHGPQGGWHVESGALMGYLRSTVEIRVRLFTGAEELANDTYLVALVGDQTNPCDGYYPNMRSFLEGSEGDENPPPERLAYTSATLETRAVDSDGHGATAAVEVILVPDPIDITPTPSETPSEAPSKAPH